MVVLYSRSDFRGPKLYITKWVKIKSIGNATRYCQSDATWAPPDVSQCENVLFGMLRITVSVI